MPILQKNIKVGGQYLAAGTTINKDHPNYEDMIPFFEKDVVDVPVEDTTIPVDQPTDDSDGGAGATDPNPGDQGDQGGIDSITKNEIMAQLKEKGIEFNPKAAKAELFALL